MVVVTVTAGEKIALLLRVPCGVCVGLGRDGGGYVLLRGGAASPLLPRARLSRRDLRHCHLSSRCDCDSEAGWCKEGGAREAPLSAIAEEHSDHNQLSSNAYVVKRDFTTPDLKRQGERKRAKVINSS